ncbi:MAG: RnfABCDGE type electron transport complex subunit B [Deltaproteobacteria bacterium]|nr:RnfABCDGE type electron transport complex subunit B [Deltaproteobacteria bacterium]MBW2417584.1 RnfABCDGE type electron transport complex subunit B [Deltaproteobacteria bacterium]
MSIGAVLVSAATLGGLGFAFGVLIAVANRRFAVWQDPRIDVVSGLLPGTNCGACGQAGCNAFAGELVAGSVQPATCTVMGAGDIEEVASILGVEAGEALKRVARLLCAGGSDVAQQRADYRGLESCGAAAQVARGGKSCSWGCLGLADCAEACDFDAIFMNRDDLPTVIPESCTACGDCVEACPLDLFTIMPIEQKLLVQCKSLLEGDEAEALCRVACTGCGKCALDAAPGLVEMVDGLAVVDYEKNESAEPGATARCPTGAIVWVVGTQFTAGTEPSEPARSAAR